MKLEGLIPLYKSMKHQDIERYKFEYKAGKAVFDVYFFIDDSPYLLLFGVKSANFSFEIPVLNGFVISPMLDRETYTKLCEVLGLEYDPTRPFSPRNFFSEFNANIPANVNPLQKAKPHELASYRSLAEDEDKIYFVGWRDNLKWGTNVKISNLSKTRDLLGEKAYLRCMEKNISSCWTNQKDLAVEFSPPS